MANVFSWYTQQLKRHPYVTNGLTSCTISGLGDIVAQIYRYRYVDHGRHEVTLASTSSDGTVAVAGTGNPAAGVPVPSLADAWRAVDLRRSSILTSYSLLVGVPFWLNVYKIVDWAWAARSPSIPLALMKGFTTWWFGFLSTPLFFTYNTTMENILLDGEVDLMVPLRESVAKMQREIANVCGYGLAFWSVHWIPMFYLLPPHYRLLYASNVTLVWSSVMSYIIHKGSKH